MAQLFLLGTFIVALLMQWWWVALISGLKALAPVLLRAAVMLRRKMRPTIFSAAQAFAVALVFDAARALSLLVSASHQTRRAA